jgi:hypothetical protein
MAFPAKPLTSTLNISTSLSIQMLRAISAVTQQQLTVEIDENRVILNFNK